MQHVPLYDIDEVNSVDNDDVTILIVYLSSGFLCRMEK